MVYFQLLLLLYAHFTTTDSSKGTCQPKINELNTLYLGTGATNQYYIKKSSFFEIKWVDCTADSIASLSEYALISFEESSVTNGNPNVLFVANFKRAPTFPRGYRNEKCSEAGPAKAKNMFSTKEWPFEFVTTAGRYRRTKRFEYMDPFYVFGVERNVEGLAKKYCFDHHFESTSSEYSFMDSKFILAPSLKRIYSKEEEASHPIIFLLLKMDDGLSKVLDDLRYVVPTVDHHKKAYMDRRDEYSWDSLHWTNIREKAIDAVVIIKNGNKLAESEFLNDLYRQNIGRPNILILELGNHLDIGPHRSISRCRGDKEEGDYFVAAYPTPYSENNCADDNKIKTITFFKAVEDEGEPVLKKSRLESIDSVDYKDLTPPIEISCSTDYPELVFVDKWILERTRNPEKNLEADVVTAYVRKIASDRKDVFVINSLVQYVDENTRPCLLWSHFLKQMPKNKQYSYLVWPKFIAPKAVKAAGHFVLIVFEFLMHEITVYDSLETQELVDLSQVEKTFATLFEPEVYQPYSYFAKQAQQSDGVSCGVYTCFAAKVFFKESNLLEAINNLDLRKMRNEIADELEKPVNISTISKVNTFVIPTSTISTSVDFPVDTVFPAQPNDNIYLGDFLIPKKGPFTDLFSNENMKQESIAANSLNNKISDLSVIVKNGFAKLSTDFKTISSDVKHLKSSIKISLSDSSLATDITAQMEGWLPERITEHNNFHKIKLWQLGFKKYMNWLSTKGRFFKYIPHHNSFRCELCFDSSDFPESNILFGNENGHPITGDILVYKKQMAHHVELPSHQRLEQKRSENIAKTYNSLQGSFNDKETGSVATQNMFRTVYFEAKSNIPLYRHESLVMLQINNGATLGTHHKDPMSGSRMQADISINLISDLVDYLLTHRPGFSLLLDSSTQFTGMKLVCVQIRFACVNAPNIYHLISFEIKESKTGKHVKERILPFFVNYKLERYLLTHLMSVSTDGAANMIKDGGFRGELTDWINSERLKQNIDPNDYPSTIHWIHCVNHRIELLIKDIYSIPNEFDNWRDFLARTINGCKTYFGVTASSRRNLLQKISKSDYMRFRGIFSVRWAASEYAAIRNFLHMWAYTGEFMQQQVTEYQNLHKKQKDIPLNIMTSRTFYLALKNLNFYLISAFQLDILEEFRLLSLEFQSEHLSIFSFGANLLHAKEHFADAIVNILRKSRSGILREQINRLSCRELGTIEYKECNADWLLEGWEKKTAVSNYEVALETESFVFEFDDPYKVQIHSFSGEMEKKLSSRTRGRQAENLKTDDIENLNYYQSYKEAKLTFLNKKLRKTYAETLLTELEKRFDFAELLPYTSMNSTAIIADLNNNMQTTYYKNLRKKLSETFKRSPNIIQKQFEELTKNIKSISSLYNEILNLPRETEKIWTAILDAYDEGLLEMGHELRKFILDLLSIAPSTASVERAFSQVTWMLDKRRGSFSSSTIDHILRIRTNGPPLEVYNPQRDALLWIKSGKWKSDAPYGKSKIENDSDSKSDQDKRKFSFIGKSKTIERLLTEM